MGMFACTWGKGPNSASGGKLQMAISRVTGRALLSKIKANCHCIGKESDRVYSYLLLPADEAECMNYIVYVHLQITPFEVGDSSNYETEDDPCDYLLLENLR